MRPPDLVTAKEEAKAEEMDVEVPSHTWTTHADTTGKIQAKTMSMDEATNIESNAPLWRGKRSWPEWAQQGTTAPEALRIFPRYGDWTVPHHFG